MSFNGVFFDKDRYLVDVDKVGIVISYIAMLVNIIVFAILCRKNLHSPATILMQGLAASDFLTSFSSYGLQPLFHSQYNCTFRTDLSLFACDLHYPYSSMVTHVSILFLTFHNVSYLITTCLGIQKVIAIIFPIWTRNQLTEKKTVITCVLCFMLPIALSLPRHVTIWLEDFFNIRLISQDDYFLYRKYEGIIVYSAAYYLGIQTVLMTCCCVVMLMSTVFIVFKLVTNRFQGRMTEQRKQERRSIIMIVVVLAIFLLTEVPRVLVYVWWGLDYIKVTEYLHAHSAYNMYLSLDLIKIFKENLDQLLGLAIPSIPSVSGRIIIECMDLFTVIGCLSNFVIYFVMSTKMRNEIKNIFSNCQYMIGRNTTDRTSSG
ncbi:CMKLR1 [Mytilus edulis]|uniref:CMKLR1 n=1 Tax=Mytilus edulis TaxID=6550 RepID=A0A8S3S2Y0_MYTED|nr:CMKLR1 [Mytilus edulis]